MSVVFLSYRDADSGGQARAIYEQLQERLGRENVILDVEERRPGHDIRDKIAKAIARANHVLVIIGPDWVVASRNGRRRLDDPSDLVRFEVATALRQRHTEVIPVLVAGATVPMADELPTDIADLAHRESLEVTRTHFKIDIEELITAVGGAARGPETPTLPPLEQLLEGSWVVEIRNPMGAVQVMDLRLEKKGLRGRRRFEAHSKMGPPWSAQGTWEALREGQLVMKGGQTAQYPFPQAGPYEVYLTFTSLGPHHLEGTTPVGERITWQRA
jgi:hypothetical protein